MTDQISRATLTGQDIHAISVLLADLRAYAEHPLPALTETRYTTGTVTVALRDPENIIVGTAVFDPEDDTYRFEVK